MNDTASIDLPTLITQFGCEDKCREYLEDLRWPRGVECPKCGPKTTISKIADRNQYECDKCGYQFSVSAGTVFHDTKLPLWKWFLAVYMMGVSKKGVSANQLKRMIGVSYKTAWYLCHRVRSAMASLVEEPLSGVVEMDETVHGGKARSGGRARGRGRGNMTGKALILGAVERMGTVRLKVVKNRRRKTLHGFAKEHIADEARAINTDDWSPYQGIGDEDTAHHVINHSAGQYVTGDVHTQTIESVWSLFKRSVVGTYHKLSAKHLPAYLDEMEFRFNNRENGFIFRDTLRALLGGQSLPYQALVGSR
ncbi:MAG: IS1595 family transposase [Planctomycetaceae bacterium]